MINNKERFKLYNESPLYQLFVSIMIITVTGIVLSVIFILAGILVSGNDYSVLNKLSGSQDNNEVGFIRYLLIIQDISWLIIPSVIIMNLMLPEQTDRLSIFRPPHMTEVLLVIILAFCIFPVTSFTGQINSEMRLPDTLSGIEHWMTKQEEKADNIIDLLIPAKTLTVMFLNLLLIALIPAVGEELIFRGVFQKIFSGLFKSDHAAIWVTSILFSTIHLQFYGFIPRLILGLVFGYLFYWSGTLWLPVISHFVNNAFPVILTYAQGAGKLNSLPEIPMWQQAIFLPLPLTAGLIILFYFRNNKNKPGKVDSRLTY